LELLKENKMGIDTRCGLMVGLPYKDLKALVNGFDEGLYDIDIDEMINNGQLDLGSVGYDSDRRNNVVGLFIKTTSGYSELTEDSFFTNGVAAEKELEDMIPTIEWKVYLTLEIT
jgi:hypothetical protein